VCSNRVRYRGRVVEPMSRANFEARPFLRREIGLTRDVRSHAFSVLNVPRTMAQSLGINMYSYRLSAPQFFSSRLAAPSTCLAGYEHQASAT
jgi:hypothetical protein